ncbi:TIGR00180 family glycosyltransferase [Azospirillum halopraeferens]|uniref:TIGR00180 family glycosyltransferase n=1 Tax=Azospirillum halopraeferens TaxID=34010 RepID=UPI000409F19F|nr:TIGR00180 family glycosyltransferase [Azospirillum halopraeferens]
MLTLIVPTYNRPELLARLLRHLAAESISWPVVVMDSSRPDAAAANRAGLTGTGLDIDHIVLPGSTTPFDKFRDGFARVRTPYAVLCADDDVVIPAALGECVRFLEEHPSFAAAHGLYYTFLDERRLAGPVRHYGDGWHRVPADRRSVLVQNVCWQSPSLAAPEPAQRLADLFRRYEALTYAVMRTEIARTAFDLARLPRSVMFRELVSSAIPVIHGKVARLPRLYCGRSTEVLTTYESWHPVEWLSRSPEALVRDGARARQVLGAVLASATGLAAAEAARTVDLCLLRYLAGNLTPGLVDVLLDGALAGRTDDEVRQAAWAQAHAAPPPPAAGLPLLPPEAGPPAPGERVERVVRHGAVPLTIRLQPGFLRAGPPEEVVIDDDACAEVVRSLAGCL